MKPEVYDDILRSIRNFRGMSKDCSRMLREKYSSISTDTLYSILSIQVQQRMRIKHSRLFDGNKNYYTRYLEAVEKKEPVGILLRMSVEIDVPPALLSRHILKKYCEDKRSTGSRVEVTKLFRDTALIDNRDLAYEIYLCILYDNQYGPIEDAVGLSIGQEYEIELRNNLAEHKVAFHDEEHLRLRGYDKTPDIKLEVPIAVNGFVINWIESKALFGNEEVHRKYIKEQFLSYWNRFGPGLVIYWFGFLDTLDQPSEKKFIIMDRFPEDITYMDPGSSTKTQPL